jgi:hypothetical protein
MARLYGEYIWAYIAAIRGAPLSSAERQECYRYLAQWTVSKLYTARSEPSDKLGRPAQSVISVDTVVAGREKRLEKGAT